MKRAITIYNPEFADIAISRGIARDEITHMVQPTIDDVKQYIVENPHVKTIIAPSIPSLSGKYKVMERFVDYCFANRVNIIIPSENMALFTDDGDIGIKFKMELLLQTDFERFN